MTKHFLPFLFLLFCVAGVVSSFKHVSFPGNFSTMQAKLAEIFKVDTFPGNQCLNEQGVAYYTRSLKIESREQYFSNLFYLAKHLLNLGKTDSAVQVNHTLLDSIKNGKLWTANKPRPEMERIVSKNLALCYLRMGEQQNCLNNHNAYSCIIPLQPQAFHTNKTGSEKAIELYSDILAKNPTDYMSRWLLNIAYMTLGKYPQEVPKSHFINLNKYDSDYSIPRFQNIATELGVNALNQLGGANAEDFNNDGYLDLFTTSYKLKDNVNLYLNDGNGGFKDVTAKAGLVGITGGVNSNHADYDNDGDIDIYVIRGGWLLTAVPEPNSLLRNNGDGTFTDVTQQAGLLSYGFSHTANWGDFNNDGWLDLFVGMEQTQIPGETDHFPRSELYLNNGDGTFKEVSETCGVNIKKWVKGSIWGDYNNDGFIDLYVSNMGAKNLLFKNNGCNGRDKCLPTFTEVAEQANVADPVFSFGSFFFDFNNDGWQDLYVTGYSNENFEMAQEYLGIAEPRNPPKFYLNKKDGTFENNAPKIGLNRSIYAMSMNFGDIDNDGWLDVFAGTGYAELEGLMPDLMFRNNEGKELQDVTKSGGFGMLQKGHGIAFGDLDNDGDQDIYMNSGGFLSGDKFWNLLFHNPGNANHWISLNLEGVGEGHCNKSAIGTRIKLKVKTTTGYREQFIIVGTGGCYGASSLQQEIGLGSALAVEEIEVKWHGSGVVQVFKNVEMDAIYKVIENNSTLVKVVQKRLNYTASKEVKPKEMHHHH